MATPRLRVFGSTVAHIKRSGSGEAHTAEQIHFDSDGTPLSAETVQDAIVQAAAGGGGGGSAVYVFYDNASSGLDAENVQEAVDELAARPAGGGGAASDVTYDNSESGLASEDVQAAVDELASRPSGGGPASETTYDNASSGLDAEDVQAAVDELAARPSGGGAADAVAYDNASSELEADNVQEALDELASRPSGGGGGSAAETTYDNTVSELEAENVQEAVDELAATSEQLEWDVAAAATAGGTAVPEVPARYEIWSSLTAYGSTLEFAAEPASFDLSISGVVFGSPATETHTFVLDQDYATKEDAVAHLTAQMANWPGFYFASAVEFWASEFYLGFESVPNYHLPLEVSISNVDMPGEQWPGLVDVTVESSPVSNVAQQLVALNARFSTIPAENVSVITAEAQPARVVGLSPTSTDFSGGNSVTFSLDVDFDSATIMLDEDYGSAQGVADAINDQIGVDCVTQDGGVLTITSPVVGMAGYIWVSSYSEAGTSSLNLPGDEFNEVAASGVDQTVDNVQNVLVDILSRLDALE